MKIVIFSSDIPIQKRVCHKDIDRADIVLAQKSKDIYTVMKNKVSYEFADQTLKEVTLLIRPKNSIEMVGNIECLKDLIEKNTKQ